VLVLQYAGCENFRNGRYKTLNCFSVSEILQHWIAINGNSALIKVKLISRQSAA